MDEPARYALEAFREAVRLGFPVYAKRLLKDVILVETGRGKGVIYLNLVEGEGEDDFYVAGSAERHLVFNVRLARVSAEGSLLEVYPENVPGLVAQHVRLISTFEADVWHARLRAVRRSGLSFTGEAPEEARRLAEKFPGSRIALVGETGDYAIVLGDAVVAWYNPVTGHVDEVYPYQVRMGVLAPQAGQRGGAGRL